MRDRISGLPMRPLALLATLPACKSLADDDASKALLAVLRNELDLSFELELVDAPPVDPALAPPVAPPPTPDTPPPPAPSPLERWRSVGAEYLVQTRATPQADGALELAVVLDSLRDPRRHAAQGADPLIAGPRVAAAD